MTPTAQPSIVSSFTKENVCLKISKSGELYTAIVPIPSFTSKQVLIHIKCTGVCGSDIHLWKEGGIGDMRIEDDLIIGHETAGQIIAVGADVTHDLKVGDRVAIEPQLPCGQCFLCMNGNYNLCQEVDFLGMPNMNGSMQRYLPFDPKFCHKLPDNISYEEGALAEVFSVAYHGIERAGGLELGKGAMIAGCGPIGLATLLLANSSGAYPLAVTDISQERLDFAKVLVPSVKTYKLDMKLSVRENAEKIRALFGTTEYEMPPNVLECTGVASSINTCCYVVRRKGTLTVIGVSGKNEIDGFPFMTVSFGEVDIKFVNRYKDSWPAVLNLFASRKVDALKFVTHRIPLETAPEALKTFYNPSIRSMKVMVKDDINLL